VEWVKIRTRQFAKRQMTWFRRQMALKWIDLADQSSPESLAERVIHDFHFTDAKNA
jgi:tRNA dimethylallyltransferase